ncbi:hypothetical protein D3C87_298670 [compost metagenome]
MLNNYTWSDYLTAAAILIAGYYLVIGGLYYRTEIKNLLSGKIKFKSRNISEDYTAPGEREEMDFDELEAVVGDLKSSVFDQAGEEVTKSELLTQLKDRVANYGGLRRPAYRVAVNHYIIQHAQESCGVAFSESELDAVWNKLPR